MICKHVKRVSREILQTFDEFKGSHWIEKKNFFPKSILKDKLFVLSRLAIHKVMLNAC